MSLKRFSQCMIILALAFMTISCGSAGVRLIAVEGQCTLDGKACNGATVILEPVDGSALKPSGVVDDDGKFKLKTHPHGDGAPVGEYVVLVTKYPEDARSQNNPKNLLPAKYADAKKTPIPKVKIDGNTKTLPTIELSSK